MYSKYEISFNSSSSLIIIIGPYEIDNQVLRMGTEGFEPPHSP